VLAKRILQNAVAHLHLSFLALRSASLLYQHDPVTLNGPNEGVCQDYAAGFLQMKLGKPLLRHQENNQALPMLSGTSSGWLSFI
jgi:hypothetical protein